MRSAKCRTAITPCRSARRRSAAPGTAVTVLAYGTMVYVAQAAAEETGIDAEIIDLRTLLPLDLDTIVASVKKTGRCVVVHEATLTSGFGAELVGAGAGDTASTTSKRRSRASPAGTRPIRMRRNGTISPARRASAAALRETMEA